MALSSVITRAMSSGMDKKCRNMFMEGKHFLPPALRAWRRITLLLVRMQQSVTEGSVMSQAVSKFALKAKGLGTTQISPRDCTHPWWAQRSGGNQHAEYRHCSLCKERTFLLRRNQEKTKDNKEGKKASKDKEKPMEKFDHPGKGIKPPPRDEASQKDDGAAAWLKEAAVWITLTMNCWLAAICWFMICICSIIRSNFWSVLVERGARCFGLASGPH